MPRKKSPVTGDRSRDPPTSSAVHYLHGVYTYRNLYIFIAEVQITFITSSVAGENLPEDPSTPTEEAKNSLQETHSLIHYYFLIFVLFYVFLCCSVYCLFCVVLCIVCVYMCTELLPLGGYPIAVKYIIISYISFD